MSNNGIPPLNDWQADNYPVIYDEGADELQYVKTGNKTTINTGGSSYLVYRASVSQANGTANLTMDVFQNTFGEELLFIRDFAGYYFCDTNLPYTINTKVWISGLVPSLYIPVYLSANLQFVYFLDWYSYGDPGNEKLGFEIEFKNSSGVLTDLFDVIGTNKVYLGDIGIIQ